MCECAEGYEGNGTFCESMLNVFICYMIVLYVVMFDTLDIDECQNETLNNCDDNADCSDTDGSFNCACREGYAGTGVDCQGVYNVLL